MARRSDQRTKRVLGTVVGAGFCLVGAYTILGGQDLPDPGRRLLWYGLSAIIIGLIAITGSWWVDDADRIWCRHPPRTWR